jgi:hypothetical protein
MELAAMYDKDLGEKDTALVELGTCDRDASVLSRTLSEGRNSLWQAHCGRTTPNDLFISTRRLWATQPWGHRHIHTVLLPLKTRLQRWGTICRIPPTSPMK